jgi:hypothetical protein
MKPNSFDRAMKQIENEFATQRVVEERQARRHELMARLRTVAGVLVLLGVCGAAYAYRGEIQNVITTEFVSPVQPSCKSATTTPQAAAASAIKAAQENARVRDALIDGTMK